MLIHNSNGSSGGHERQGRNNDSFFNSALGYNLYHDKPEKKLTYLKIALYSLGFTGTGWLLYFQVGGWKANVIWALVGAVWFIQFIRACVKLYFEIQEKKIELQEKRARYNKDIFT